MELYAGIDLHSNNSVVSVLDEQDRTVYAKRLPNDLGVIVAALRACFEREEHCGRQRRLRRRSRHPGIH